MFDKAGNSVPSPTSAIVERSPEESAIPEETQTARTTQAAQPSANAETIKTSKEDKLKSSFGQNSKFLTNDIGQSMNQALLLMAQVAADWSDYDDDDEEEAETEIAFQEKLHQALRKQMQQSKPLGEAQSRVGVLFAQPAISDSSQGSGHTDLRPVKSYVGQGQWYQPDAVSFPYQSSGDQVPFSCARVHHKPLLLPRTGSHESNGLPSQSLNGMVHPGTVSGSLARLKAEARSPELPISDTMGFDQLTNLLMAHDGGVGLEELTARNKYEPLETMPLVTAH
jgi:hypothetical protein